MGDHRVVIVMLDGEADIVNAVISFATKLGIVVAVESDDQDTPPAPQVRPAAPFTSGDRVEAVNSDTKYAIHAGRHGIVLAANVPRKGSVLVRWDGEPDGRRCRASLLRLALTG